MISKRNSARLFLFAGLVIALLLALFTQRRTSQIEATMAEIDRSEGLTAGPSPLLAATTPALEKTPPAVSAQLRTFDEILQSGNENDPRIDQDLKVLSPEAKQALRDRYRSLPAEKRNQRGFIVFLLGRNLTETGDFKFMRSVLEEPACLSLEDCQKATPSSLNKSEEEHHPMGAVLAYPQLAALYALGRTLPFLQDENLKGLALDALKTAEHSPVTEVRQKAQSMSR